VRGAAPGAPKAIRTPRSGIRGRPTPARSSGTACSRESAGNGSSGSIEAICCLLRAIITAITGTVPLTYGEVSCRVM
jgi:hypothetical protein